MTQVDNNTESRKGTHLTLAEMHKIEGYKVEKHSNREIARLLGRSPQTINNAIKSGTVSKITGKPYSLNISSALIHLTLLATPHIPYDKFVGTYQQVELF